ncbi:hypothetical protein D1B31_12575 [Neobacillus notoginsengisoli]|uniref:Uncharacterized protein n=1 Tax=Neobacillus notoginsengisoli TaxID=1578198 RepID=A0A417YTP9_9BACI|nr:hypothetical protein [Neobacillus notoginsengisoli]RHW40376.1 hypothetical protein D1B31_12575 [Neobacillus notoginsengisoli]
MARNIIETIINIFGQLESLINDEEKVRIIPAEKRIIAPSNHDYINKNMKVLKNSNVINKVLLNYNTNIFGLSFDNRSYVLIPGTSQLEDGFSPGFILKATDIEQFADGFKLIAMSEKLVAIKSEIDLSLLLVDKIFGLQPNDNKEVIYDINEIVPFYADFEVWEIDQKIFDINNENDLFRIYILWRISNEKETENRHKFSLNFLFNTLEQYVKLTQNPNSKHIAKVLFRAVSSTSWEHCYLELYRCIEKLYTIYHIDYLQGQLKMDTNNIANSLENIGFKSREVNDVTKLFKKISTNQYLFKKLKEEVFNIKSSSEKISLSQETLNNLKDLVENNTTANESEISFLFNKLKKEFTRSSEDNLIEISEKMAEKLYTIRCNIAHLSYKHNHVDYDDEQWNNIIFIILNIIEELYDIYGKRLEELSLI